MKSPQTLSALALAGFVSANSAFSATTIYSTSFTSFTQPTNYITDFNIIYGGIDPGANFTKASSGVWGITTAGNAFASGVARPLLTTNLNHRFIGLFLDPTLFAPTGAGTYTVSFDITGVAGANSTYNAKVYAGSGYDLSGATDKRLNLALNSAGAPITATGAGVVVSTLATRSLSVEATSATTQSVSFDFVYDGTSALAFSIGGFGNGSLIDNFAVTTDLAPVPEPSAFAALAGVGALGAATLRRRRRA